MARAPRICSTPGCPTQAVAFGKCAEHKPKYRNPEPWARRAGIPRTSSAWRRAVLERDGHVCRQCGDRATEADHIVSRALAPERAADVDNGQALCSDCHRTKTLAEAAAARRRRVTPGGPPSP